MYYFGHSKGPSDTTCLTILVGLPGAGKTTWALQRGRDLLDDPVVKPHETIVVSIDRLRAALPGERGDHAREAVAFDRFYRYIAELLGGRDEHGRPIPQPATVIADSACLHHERRARLREIARHCGAECHVMLFTAVEEALERNAKRERPVRPAIMAVLIERFEDARKRLDAEGYDSVSVVFTGE